MTDDLILNTVVKTFGVLEFLSESDSSYTLSRLAKTLQLSLGTVQRIIATLIELGYLSRDPETKTFRLTSKWIRIGLSVLNDLDIRKIAYPHLKELNEETNETVSLAIIDNGEVVLIERFETRHFITTNMRPGVRRPIHSNSIGKAILAFLSDSEVNKIISHISFAKFTDNTIVDKDTFYIELKRIRENGYSVNDEESEKGIFAFGVPIFNSNDTAIAGISLVIPKARFSKSLVYKKYLPAIIRKGNQISRELGNFKLTSI